MIPETIDFVYVMRRDSTYVATQFANRLGALDALPSIVRAYDDTVDRLAESILRAFRSVHRSPAVELLDAAAIHARRLELIAELGGGLVVSMDPLMEEGAVPLAFSRCYETGGVDFIEMIPRPGYPALHEQVAIIADRSAGLPIVVVEDDFFSGDTLTTMLGQHLGGLMRRVAGVVAGTKVGRREPAFRVLPAVRYLCPDGRDPIDKVDLGDPRDYIVGASGLVCRLPSGHLGRLPYLLPFVSPAARASIPSSAEAEFSREAWALSVAFYEDLAHIIGREVPSSVADPAFLAACQELLGVSSRRSMTELLVLASKTSLGAIST